MSERLTSDSVFKYGQSVPASPKQEHAFAAVAQIASARGEECFFYEAIHCCCGLCFPELCRNVHDGRRRFAPAGPAHIVTNESGVVTVKGVRCPVATVVDTISVTPSLVRGYFFSQLKVSQYHWMVLGETLWRYVRSRTNAWNDLTTSPSSPMLWADTALTSPSFEDLPRMPPLTAPIQVLQEQSQARRPQLLLQGLLRGAGCRGQGVQAHPLHRVFENRLRVDCGIKDPVVLDADHQRDKAYEVSTLLHGNFTWRFLEKELAKCVVRCANCHRRRTGSKYGNYRMVKAGRQWRSPSAVPLSASA